MINVPSGLRVKSNAELTPTEGATTSNEPRFEFGGSTAATSPDFVVLPAFVTVPKKTLVLAAVTPNVTVTSGAAL